MAFWSGLIGGGVKEAGEGVKTALDGAGGFLKDIRTSITGKDPEMDAKLLAAEDKINEAQSMVNALEAKSSSVFIAGWRPAIGWVCVLALGLYYPTRIVTGMTIWVIQSIQSMQAFVPTVQQPWIALPPMPEVGMADVLGLVLTMLGSAGLRTIEKSKDVAR